MNGVTNKRQKSSQKMTMADGWLVYWCLTVLSAHCDCLLFCALEILLLTYLLTFSTNMLYRATGVWYIMCRAGGQDKCTIKQLLLSCAKSHMLSASRRQPHLLHVSAVDRRQTWSIDKSWRCVTLSGFLHSHIVRCRWNPISCSAPYSGPGMSWKRFSGVHWRRWR